MVHSVINDLYNGPADLFTGSLACSPFHVRFGKFSLLRPYEKKVQNASNVCPTQAPLVLAYMLCTGRI